MSGPATKYDALVIGAGPAGCAAGVHLAKTGARVLVLERSRFPRRKVCGGLLTDKAKTLAEEVLGGKLKAHVPVASSSIYQVRKLAEPINSISTTTKMHGVDRMKFDAALFEALKTSGAKIREEAKIELLAPKESRAVLKSGEEIAYDHLIGADGVHSLTARTIGITQNKSLIAPAFQCDIPLELARKLGLDVGHKAILGYIGYGWGWSFEKPESVTIGLAGLGVKAIDLKARFFRMLTDIGLTDKERDSLKVEGSPVPFGSYLKSPAKGRTLLTGDAAGLVEPISGEGIQFALLSGKLAAKAIAEHPTEPASAYTRSVAQEILPELKEARMFRPLLFTGVFQSAAIALIVKNDRNLDAFLCAIAGERSYKKCLFDAVMGRG